MINGKEKKGSMNKIISFSCDTEGRPATLLIGAERGGFWVPAIFFSCHNGKTGEIKPIGEFLHSPFDYFACDDNLQNRICLWLNSAKPEIYQIMLNILEGEPLMLPYKG